MTRRHWHEIHKETRVLLVARFFFFHANHHTTHGHERTMNSGWRAFVTRPHCCYISILALVPLGLRKDVVARAQKEDHQPTLSSVRSVDLADLSPIAPIRIFQPNPDMEIAFDVRSRTPLYVLQRVCVHDYRKGEEDATTPQQQQQQQQHRPRRRRFYEEKSIPLSFRSRNGHYHHSGYDRGHLAPAADFYHNESFLEDSYNLINVAPQNQDMNRKIWARLEDWTRRVARNNAARKQSGNNTGTTTEVYAVTGLLWLPSRQVGEKRFEYNYPGLGVPPSLLAVPTHFFKLVVVLETSQQQRAVTKIRKFACFVVPNDETASSKELKDYLVRWTDLEAVSGIEFFPGLASEEFKATADNLASRLLPTAKGQPLLLTDGGSSSSPTSPQKWYLRERTAVQHLCQEQMCSPPYKDKADKR